MANSIYKPGFKITDEAKMNEIEKFRALNRLVAENEAVIIVHGEALRVKQDIRLLMQALSVLELDQGTRAIGRFSGFNN